MSLNSFFNSKKFRMITWSIAAVIVLLVVFKAGMIAGYRKANFSYRWGENYHRNFGGPRRGFFNNFFDKDFIESHGVFGQVLKKDGDILVMKGRDNTEKIIVIREKTIIRSGREDVTVDAVKPDNFMVVIGAPDDRGRIVASFIRLMPESFMPRQQ